MYYYFNFILIAQGHEYKLSKTPKMFIESSELKI